MTAGETLKLPETQILQIHDLSCGHHVRFQVRDPPGPNHTTLHPLEFDKYSNDCNALIFVIDAHDDFKEALVLLTNTIRYMYERNRQTRFEVLIHKVDGLQENKKMDIRRELQQNLTDILIEYSIENALINFYLTSIYDHSIHEAFSKVIQNQTKQLRALENMLQMICTSTQLDKIFLCDINNKIFLATDNKPVEPQIYELCCDLIDVYVDIASIYESNDNPVLDSMSFCTIELSIGVVLYLKDINEVLALICLVRKESAIKEGLIEHNLQCLKNAVEKLFVHDRLTPMDDMNLHNIE
ncbi:unnamed protein product [Didymodactylos carnosus]|uniref:GTP-binding protein n=1 Tax=Didymodactylos carnosus TaxID=1234261 RepID=A0A814JLC7_9BILA|nr:unnamed protein product [Didymodactylos carnosus]CAF1039273.1 unnamed protein product [Didymodactylos carnosus]CAF3731714.1 unnamed protein product [Didymodactylos carnosus]CAF3809612.1 unnamed protein product [Didymodactylos carnosus]